MKKISLLMAIALIFFSCDKKAKENQDNKTSESQTTEEVQKKENASAGKINIEDIPYSNSDLGEFPFFTLPKGLVNQNKPLQKNFDVCFFPVNGIMTPFEGKLYKTNVVSAENEEFSKMYFEKSLEDYLSSIGAVKVYDGEITESEYNRYQKQDPNKGNEGDMGYADEQIKFYVIRTKDKGNIYIQFSANSASGKLNILQEANLKQTIQKITADEIVKDLSEKGKSILYINFEINKADLTEDGSKTINEIFLALKKDPSLNISIEGHTDNTGDAQKNKKLSLDRANSVMNALVSKGINKSKLTAKGFGSEHPLVSNDSEENKAKNRRVELVKVK
ncbi:OmpA family protein [Flavobacterium sp. LPB0248]|uniref:OmpA family protein n=1 Tax=Flavobacterium sp. LPB0248 TaxID=2614441 RepID=UPI0015A6A2E4|nr:OmpA family protein [Flavobacterium sp. LPB0248]QLC65732.1 OmpA family protein [Flavobacterium sp. LPB0248]